MKKITVVALLYFLIIGSGLTAQNRRSSINNRRGVNPSFEIPRGPVNGGSNPQESLPGSGNYDVQINVSLNSSDASDGVNLYSPMRSTRTYLVDNDGQLVRSWNSQYRPGLSVYLLPDGSLLRTANVSNQSFAGGGSGGLIEKYNWDGDLVWSFDYSSDYYCQHHDIECLPNGNILMIAWEKKSKTEALMVGRKLSLLKDDELWVDYIVEVEPTGESGGRIVWEWHMWDHLVQDVDSEKPNYGNISDHPDRIDINYVEGRGIADWSHINSIDYNAELDQILLSVRGFSEVWIIDHSTTTQEAASSSGGRSNCGGDLLYRWGNPSAYQRGTKNDQKLFVQHDAQWIDSGYWGEGDILIFNNGQGRIDGNYSTVDQITPPSVLFNYIWSDYSGYDPSDVTWKYPEIPLSDFYASRISGVQRLPNGNTLVCEGTTGFVFEVNVNGGVVWECEVGQEIFRFERYSREEIDPLH